MGNVFIVLVVLLREVLWTFNDVHSAKEAFKLKKITIEEVQNRTIKKQQHHGLMIDTWKFMVSSLLKNKLEVYSFVKKYNILM